MEKGGVGSGGRRCRSHAAATRLQRNAFKTVGQHEQRVLQCAIACTKLYSIEAREPKHISLAAQFARLDPSECATMNACQVCKAMPQRLACKYAAMKHGSLSTMP